jgi:hypothetical protein
MPSVPEVPSARLHYVYDVGRLALIGILLLPFYLVLNQYWQSLVRLLVLYALLAFFCLRLAEYMRRAMHRLPAEIPPWQGLPTKAAAVPWLEQRFGAAEAIRSARRDPQYVEAVLKPRLQRLVAYRLSGTVDVPWQALDRAQLAMLEPDVLAFIRRQEPTGLWARYWYRRQRVRDVIEALRRIEAL